MNLLGSRNVLKCSGVCPSFQGFLTHSPRALVDPSCVSLSLGQSWEPLSRVPKEACVQTYLFQSTPYNQNSGNSTCHFTVKFG